MLKARLQKFAFSALFPRPAKSTAVTADDLYYAYRLFLEREPAAEELQSWLPSLQAGRMTLGRLNYIFLNSPEFRALQHERHKPHLVELDGFKIHVRADDSAVGADIERNRRYEPYVEQEMRPHLNEGCVLLDIGANIGYFTLLGASLVGTTGKVIAFEPVPDNCELIRLSYAVNGFENVVLYPHAVLDREQECAFLMDGSDASLIEQAAPANSLATSVVLDQVLSREERIDVVKMDIEGSEARAWLGMRNIIARHRPIVFTEFHPEALASVSKVEPVDYLRSIEAAGYQLFVLRRDGPRSESPEDPDTIMALYAQLRPLGHTHLDLVAYPC